MTHFPAKTDEHDQFFCALHNFAMEYHFGNVVVRRLPQDLWCAEDENGFRLTAHEVFVGRPDREHVTAWIQDTSHAFSDLLRLLAATGADILPPVLVRLPTSPQEPRPPTGVFADDSTDKAV